MRILASSLIAALLGLTLVACGGGAGDQLVGNWTMDAEPMLADAKATALEQIGKEESELSDAEKEVLEQALEAARERAAGMKMTFNADGTYKFTFGPQVQEGTYTATAGAENTVLIDTTPKDSGEETEEEAAEGEGEEEADSTATVTFTDADHITIVMPGGDHTVQMVRITE